MAQHAGACCPYASWFIDRHFFLPGERTKEGEGRMTKLLWEENDATKAVHQRLVAQIVQLIVTSPVAP